MPRGKRIIIPRVAHHIIQRGNNQQWILEDPEDFSTYCYLINKYVVKYKVNVVAYCLMHNHVHFILVPEKQTGVSSLFNTVHMRYAQYKNYKKMTNGHLWQGRFFSCVLGDSHLFYAIRYVEQNPMRAGMVKYPWDYVWSSAKWHVGKPVKKYIRTIATDVVDKQHWKKYLMNSEKGIDDELRRKTHKGKAFGSDEFIAYWEQKLGCVLKELRPGPKRKKR